MSKVPRITIDGADVEFIQGSYVLHGNFSSANLEFILPDSQKWGDMWNKEVTFFVDKGDSKPIFRGWINRTKRTFENLTVYAEDAMGFLLKGGDMHTATVALTNRENIDGLTVGAAAVKLIELAKLDDKVKTDYIRDTSPRIGTVQKKPLRGEMTVAQALKTLLQRPINLADQDLPRPNILKVGDDGTNAQLMIELQADVNTAPIQHIYTEQTNIVKINIINRKPPTYIVVKGKGGVKGTFTHDGARAALDTNYLEVVNDNLDSPAACKEFGARLYQANLADIYEYGVEVTDGFYLAENEVIRIQTNDEDYSGNYRILGKRIEIGNNYKVGIIINRKAPTLIEYLESRDN